MEWSHYQQAIFEWVEKGKGSAIVEAVAGSGKTTTLLEIVKRASGRVFLCAFNKKMAEELKARTTGMREVFAATFHSVGFQAYRKVYPSVRVESGKMDALMEEYEKAHEGKCVPRAYVGKLVRLLKQHGAGIVFPMDALEHYQELADHFSLADLLPNGTDPEKAKGMEAEAMELACGLLEASNEWREVVDFEDMLYLPLLLNLQPYRYDWVLVDEAQDTNPVRLLLAERCMYPHSRVVAVGDPRQAIYGFSGADARSLEHIATKFGAVRFPLSVCYRCGTEIVAHARRWVQHIEPFEGQAAGEVKQVPLTELLGFKPGRGDAILCRVNKHLVSLAFRLIREGVPCRIEGRDIGQGLITLTHKWKVKSLERLREMVELYRAREIKKAEAQAGARGRMGYKVAEVEDKTDTLFILIERAQEKGLDVDGLRGMISEMFADNVKGSGMLCLSSVHKAKGMEWERVFILGRRSLMPSKYARQDWALEQEHNLIYVAVTRAKRVLVEVEEFESMQLRGEAPASPEGEMNREAEESPCGGAACHS